MFSIFDQDMVWSKWIMAVISFVGVYYFLRYYKQFRKDIFYIFLSSVLIGQIFSLFVSLDRASTFRLIVFQASITFVYPFIRKYSDKNGFKKLFKAYLVTFYFVFAFLIFQLIYQSVFGKLTGGIWPVPGHSTRYGSTFWDVNHFGAYLNSMFFLFLSCWFAFRKQKNRIAYLIGAILSFVALTFTDSRSAMLGFIAGFLLFSGFAFKERVHEKLVIKDKYLKFLYSNSWIWGSILFVISSFSVLILFQDQIHRAFIYRSTSFFSHLYLLKAGISLAIQNFSSGIGANAFYAYFKQSDWASAYYYIDKAALNYKLPLHNLWLEVLVETGIISFVIFTIMWIVGMGLLVKLFRKKNDFLALGFASGILAFLVGGLFYSYKAEFFWVYVIIAFVYGSKDLDENVIVEKIKDAKYIFYYIFENDYRFRKFLMVGFAIFSVITLMGYIFNPILPSELFQYYKANTYSLWTDPFLYLINLMRYDFGNYSFSGRIVTSILFIASYIIFIGLNSKIFKFYKSIVVSSIIMSIFSIFVPASIVSPFYLYLFIILIPIYLVVALLLRDHKKKFKIDYRILAGLLGLFVFVAHVSIYQNMSMKSFDKDLAFLVELGSNRSVLNNSTIWIEDPKNYDLVKYYSDHVERSEIFKLNYRSENIKLLDNLNEINFYDNNVFIVSGLNKYLLEEAIQPNEIIKHKNYYIVIVEPAIPMELGYQLD